MPTLDKKLNIFFKSLPFQTIESANAAFAQYISARALFWIDSVDEHKEIVIVIIEDYDHHDNVYI